MKVKDALFCGNCIPKAGAANFSDGERRGDCVKIDTARLIWMRFFGATGGSVRVLVCGDRNWTDRKLIESQLIRLDEVQGIDVVIEGEARGADSIGRDVALEVLKVPVERFPAQWDKFGRAAGPIRNQQMLTEGKPDWVIAFHDDIKHSKGTRDMKNRAERAGIPVEVISHG